MFIEKRKLSDQDKINWLRLIRTENVGPITFYHLLRQFGTIDHVFDNLKMLVRNGGKRETLHVPSQDIIEKEIDQLSKLGGRFIFACEHDYPESLNFIEDAPPVLSCIGNIGLLENPIIGVVGARNSSLNGEKFAEQISKDIGAQGYIVASGLARGIDRSAHLGALETGTIAVVAGGANYVYPPENQDIYDQICETGLVLSENPLNMEPTTRHFPRRNRIVSGISRGIVVVEAAPKSGSLITARYALEHGREIFAVPGSPFDQRCKGTNNLIREGATLVEKIEDIMQVLSSKDFKQARFFENEADGFVHGPIVLPSEEDLSKAREIIIEKLGSSPTDIDLLFKSSGVTQQIGLTVILELELAGRLARDVGQKVCLIS